MGLSNHLLSILNFLTGLLSIPIIGAGIWLATKHNTECVRFLQWPVIALGVFVLLISIAGLVGSSCRVTWILFIYLAVMLLLILLLIAFTIFTFVVTNKGAGHLVSGKGYKEYHLGDYSTWLQRQVNKASNWDKIKSCLSDAKICSSLEKNDVAISEFYKDDLSPIQSGCCKPPTVCNFTYVNATYWINPTNSSADADCTEWNNAQGDLCFNCNSCRAGVLQTVKKDWKKVALVNVVVLVFFIIVYSVGCCAFRNARREGMYSRYPVYRKG